MVDREKDILGKITEGVTGDAKLVASNEYAEFNLQMQQNSD